MSVSIGQGVTVAAAVVTSAGNADSALADVLDRVVPVPTSRWAAMVEEAPAMVRFPASLAAACACSASEAAVVAASLLVQYASPSSLQQSTSVLHSRLLCLQQA